MAEEVKAAAAEPIPDQTSESAAEAPAANGDAADSKVSEESLAAKEKDEKSPSATTDDRKRKRYDDDDRKPYQRKYTNYKDNVKSKYDDLPESSDPDEIREQVEFYFSDSNLLQDKFLFEQTGGAENQPIPIKKIHSFKRMQHFQPYSAVLAALKESKILEVVNDSEIKRRTPLKLQENMSREQNIEYFENEATKRSIYAKGFGEETSTTQLDVENFFKPYGPINSVRLRRSYPEKEFKGSVFVEFETIDLMQEFLDLENKPKWKDTDELQIKSKADYCQGKIEDIKAGKIKPNESYFNTRERHGGRGRGRGRGGNDRHHRRDRDDRDRDSNDWKGRRDNFQKGGFKDRNDRNGRRGGRDNRDNFGRDRDRRNDDEGSKQEFDESGIPIVRATSRDPAPKPANGDAKADAEGLSKKRSRDDDGAEGNEAKKSKADEVATAA